MKIAVVSDLHLNKSVYKGVMDKDYPVVPFRNVDFMKAFLWVCDEIIKINPDLMVISGDIYDNHNPSNRIRRFFSKQIRKIKDKNIPIIVLVGNHDVCRDDHALSDIYALGLENVTVIEKPTIIDFKNKHLLLFPYSLDIEQKNISIRKEFDKFIELVRSENKNESSLFFGHFGVSGAKINEFEEVIDENEESESQVIKKAFINRNKDDISVNELDAIGSDYVFLGDYHQFQILPTKRCIALYTGSLEKTDMADKNGEKGFVLYDSDTVFDDKLKNCQFIKYTNCRPMLEIKGTLQEIQKEITSTDASKFKNAIVKISFSGEKNDLDDFSIKLDDLKSQINKKFDPIHVYHVQKTVDNDQKEKVLKIEKEMMEKGHLEISDIEDVVSEMIKERETDLEEQKHILILDRTIRDEVKSKKMGII